MQGGREAVNKGKVKWLVSLQITLLPVFLTSFLPEAYTMEKQRPPQMSACAVHFLHSTKCMCEGRLSGQAGRHEVTIAGGCPLGKGARSQAQELDLEP